MLHIFRVTEHSLSPEYEEGDFVIIVKIPFPFNFKRLKVGDVITFRQPGYGVMIKKIEAIYPQLEEIYVTGTHPDSIDSRHFGNVPCRHLLGKVIWHVPGPRR